jgi:hypothetical protein
MRIIVPIDINLSSSPAAGTCCSAFGLKNTLELGKFHCFRDRWFVALFYYDRPRLHGLASRQAESALASQASGITKMSAPLVVSIPHRLGRDEATRRLKAGLGRASSSIPTLQVDEERWQDNRMIFRIRALGQAASGHVDVADDHVVVEVTLPFLLQKFAAMAQVAIRNRGQLLLTKKG